MTDRVSKSHLERNISPVSVDNSESTDRTISSFYFRPDSDPATALAHAALIDKILGQERNWNYDFY